MTMTKPGNHVSQYLHGYGQWVGEWVNKSVSVFCHCKKNKKQKKNKENKETKKQEEQK